MVKIVEVKTKKEQREFINFPLKLYAKNQYFVPYLFFSFLSFICLAFSSYIKRFGWYMQQSILVSTISTQLLVCCSLLTSLLSYK